MKKKRKQVNNIKNEKEDATSNPTNIAKMMQRYLNNLI